MASTTYSIFRDPATNDLFAYVELESEQRWAAVASTDVCRRWWEYMRDLMPVNADGSPVAADLTEVFHIEAPVPLTRDGSLLARLGAWQKPSATSSSRVSAPGA